MPRDARLLSKWRVFISGVEIPHLGGSISFGRNMYGQGQIMVEPDRLVHGFRPNSKVHIFFFDRFGSTTPADPGDLNDNSIEVEPIQGSGDPDDLLKNYRLMFEGELVGLGQNKSPTARQMALMIGGEFRILQRSKMFQASIGGSYTTPLVTGGIAVPEMVVDTNEGGADVLSLTALSDNFFDGESEGLSSEPTPYRGSQHPDFAERMVAMTGFLSNFSGILRLQTVRSRLLNKIAGVPDATMKRFMRLTMSNKIFQDAQGKIDSDMSILDMITFFCKPAFYSWYHMPGPYTPPNAPMLYPDPLTGRVGMIHGQPKKVPELVPLPANLVFENQEGRSIFNFLRDFYRNDYLFLPELYFAMPPPCNFIFPEDSDSIAYQRTFDSEKTRFIVSEPYFSNGEAAYFAPPWILRNMTDDERARMSSSDFFAANLALFRGLKATGAEDGAVQHDIKSPYVSPIEGKSGGINLLSVMSDDEIEKGIICSRTYHDFEFFSAISKPWSTKEDMENEAPKIGLDGEQDNDYAHFLTELAMYRLLMESSRRDAQVSVKGHPWCVPGFSGVIFDRDSVYMGFFEQVSFTWDVQTNVETTSIGMSHVRHIPFQPPGGENQNSIEANRKAQQVVVKNLNVAKKDYLSRIADVGFASAKIKEATRAAIKDPKATRASRYGDLSVLREEGVATLNRFGMAVAKSIYSDHTEAAQRYVESRTLKKFLSGVSIEEVEKIGILDYTYDHHLPFFPENWSRSEAYNDPKNSEDIIHQATRLANDIQSYLYFQIDLLEAAVAGARVPDIDTLGSSIVASALGKTKSFDLTTRQEIARLTGFFAPPSWFNQAFLRMNSIDAIYQGLLGCQPFYSVFGHTANPGAKELTDEEVYREYVNFLQTLDKLYPFLEPDGVIPSARDVGEKAIWERLTDEDEMSPGPHWWMSTRVQHRDITTMETFLAQNGLKLKTVISSQPAPTVFYKMVPNDQAPHSRSSSGEVQGYKFDNTIFSMIVDEWELFPREGSTSDPAITKLKETAKSPALTREYRQLVVERYSKKHFGARGYDGR